MIADASTRQDAPERTSLILYDGSCGLCSRAVLFVYRRDPRARFRFSPRAPDETLVLVEPDGRRYERSTAALRIARRLRWPWPLAYALAVVPRALRDAVYDQVARRRHKLGLACPAPPPGLRERIVE